jgi:hypothetical protein
MTVQFVKVMINCQLTIFVRAIPTPVAHNAQVTDAPVAHAGHCGHIIDVQVITVQFVKVMINCQLTMFVRAIPTPVAPVAHNAQVHGIPAAQVFHFGHIIDDQVMTVQSVKVMINCQLIIFVCAIPTPVAHCAH